ncbi:unnamed protein product [Rotaria sordida]|uniref:Uncharacterized protein n=1 Tax=Rotaria sordida TaxID=392033 RepID=A0A815SJR6_9BILA|nr:unnamed protein product [Rotaria sordida]CAF1492335.1 unnamed protein product [Rotaria sordida]
MWKSIKSTDLSPLNIEDNNEESKINIEIDKQQLSLKHRNISQLILARKLQNLQEFANAYHLNLSNTDDRLLRTDTARENVQQMANDILASIEETNRINLGSFVAQMGGNNHRLLTRFRMQTFYQELVDVMPLKWKEIFEQCQQQST